MGARAPPFLSPEGFSILGQKKSLFAKFFFLPLEYKDFFFKPALLNLTFFLFYWPCWAVARQEEGWKAVPFAGVLFPKGDVIASLARFASCPREHGQESQI